MDAPARQLTRVEGLDLHWLELGSGRPTVLLHGLSDSHRTWGKVAPALARSRRVLLLDLPGHGLSARPDASYTLAWHARIVAGWLDALGLDEIDLVGHSFGGGVAQWLLLEHRRRVRRLALVAPGGLGREVALGVRLCALPIVERLGQPFMGAATRIGCSATGARFDAEDAAALGWMNAMPGTARALSRTARDVVDWRGQRRHFLDHAREIGELPPIALFWGERDPVVPFAQALETAELLDGARLTRFAKCGHFPHRECDAEFTRALEAFVDEPSCEAARLRAPVTVVATRGPRRSPIRRALGAALAGIRRVLCPRRRPKPSLEARTT
jgi:pimeloyl-ACP methyl ester carboxylesterase